MLNLMGRTSYKRHALVVILFLLFNTVNAQQPLWRSKAYALYADSIVQGIYRAKALSRTAIVSDYKSPANEFKSADISFKFSINGKDNEMVSGTDHHFTVDAQRLQDETPLIVFGRQLKQQPAKNKGYLKPGATLTVKLDMRHVLKAFRSQGYYTAFDGSKTYKDDFKGVYIAGSSSPLIWDFDNLVNHPELKMQDDDGDGIFEIRLALNKAEDERKTNSRWKLEKDLAAFPQYSSPYPLPDALYNMALEEMVKAVEPDSTFRTGKEWAGVWTRDISYSIILSMAHLQPAVARYSLLKKVNKKKKIIQDTGTGGAWPISSDRMIWAVAAWEVYKVTGDIGWLKEAYEVIKNSIYADMQTIYDRETGLVKGESSFLDWREQTYPAWMQPADIFESENLGTNAVHFEANTVAATMAGLLNDKAAKGIFEKNAERIKAAINDKFWLSNHNYYGQYLYGRAGKILSPRAEALGAALCVIFAIADESRSKQLVKAMPVTPFGITCIYPQIPSIPPYHNNGIWPFVQSFWTWAGASVKNERSVMESIAAIYRPAALFATNKENFVAESGDFAGTQINSSNMLWSLSGNISIVHRVLFGIRFDENKLVFDPFVPEALKGKRTLHNFHYRNAVLDISLEGSGYEIDSCWIDGVPTDKYEFSASLRGHHVVRIRLKNRKADASITNRQQVIFAPAAPELHYNNNVLSWQAVPGAVKYKLLANGKFFAETKLLRFTLPAGAFKEYQVMAVSGNGLESFASEPQDAMNSSLYEIEEQLSAATYPYKGFSGKGFVETTTAVNADIRIHVSVDKPGNYLLDLRYANGKGPVNTDNKCAVRSLLVDDQPIAALVFPQRGKDEWSDWGWSNALKVTLGKGEHVIRLAYRPSDENMNIDINQAMLDLLRLRKIGD